ncbi:hypothetical protein H0H87_002851 [Tephrocybe sp. NHM501043]|nr:hypothetical protein H0H87_002851 [Tephrocybe sp. NHM501043]
MPVNEYWEWTRNELEVLSRANLIRKPALVDEFEPGDFAYIEDSLATVFMEFLKRKEYRLTPNEDVLTPTKGRYCVVLQRLSLDKYIVCCCATYGGARGFQDLSDPVARHFGVPLNENTIWPGLAPLRTRPPWKSANGAFVLAIPAIRDGLTTSNLRERVRLGFQDLHRLKNIIKDRSQESSEQTIRLFTTRVSQRYPPQSETTRGRKLLEATWSKDRA